jgi:hypothetical protein
VKPGEVVLAAREQVDPGERLRVAAIESFSQPDDGGQYAHRGPLRSAEVAVSVV